MLNLGYFFLAVFFVFCCCRKACPQEKQRDLDAKFQVPTTRTKVSQKNRELFGPVKKGLSLNVLGESYF